jgi:hypothetical protein
MKTWPIVVLVVVAWFGSGEVLLGQHPNRPTNTYVFESAITQEAQPSPSDAAAAPKQVPGTEEQANSAAAHQVVPEGMGGAPVAVGPCCLPSCPSGPPLNTCCCAPVCRPCAGGFLSRCRLWHRW